MYVKRKKNICSIFEAKLQHIYGKGILMAFAVNKTYSYSD